MGQSTISGICVWVDIDNAKVSDDVYTITGTDGGTSKYLYATNFGFSIPSNSVINGVLVEIEKKGSSIDGLSDKIVQLRWNSVNQGNNKYISGDWSLTEAYVSYGSSSDLWGLSTYLTPTIVNLSTFGVALQVNIAGYAYPMVDHIRITVFYTEGSVVSAAVAFGNVVTANSPLRSVLRVASVAIGTVVTATKTAVFTRLSTVHIGVKTTASRVINLTRNASVVFGNVVSATRSKSILRFASVIQGVKVTASKYGGFIRNASVIFGEVISASKTAAFTRASMVRIGVKTSATRIGGYIRQASVVFGQLVTIAVKGRLLKIKTIIGGYRSIKVISATYRKVKSITSAYRKIKNYTS